MLEDLKTPRNRQNLMSAFKGQVGCDRTYNHNRFRIEVFGIVTLCLCAPVYGDTPNSSINPDLSYPSEAIYSAESDYFEVVGSDIKSVQYVDELATFSQEILFDEISVRSQGTFAALPRKILIQLVKFNSEKYYDLQINSLGFITLTLNWNSSLSLEKTLEGITAAFLTSFSYSYLGYESFNSKPIASWIIQCLSSDIYYKLKPTMLRAVSVERLKTVGSNLFSSGFLDTNSINTPQSYILWRYFKSLDLSEAIKKGLIFDSLKGEDVSERFYQQLKVYYMVEIFSSLDLLTKLEQSLHKHRKGQFETMETSEEWLDSLIDFTNVRIEGIPSNDINYHKLWLHRSNPDVIQLIKARIEMINLGICRINPLYYNSAQSLGLVYQKLLRGKKAWEVLYFFRDFVNEFDRSKIIHHKTDKFLKMR